MKRIFYSAFLLVWVFSACAKPYTDDHRNLWLKEVAQAEMSTVLLNNEKDVIPLKSLGNKNIASISIGVNHATVFDSIAGKYTGITPFSATNASGEIADLNNLGESLKFFDTYIIQVSDQALHAMGTVPFILESQKNKNIMLVVYGNQRVLPKLDSVTAPIIWQQTESPQSALVTSQIIFGGMAAHGKLPLSVSLKYREGNGFLTNVTRLAYTVPEAIGISSEELERPIDAIVAEAISHKATPGAVVLVAKDGKVIFNKAYGYHTYDNRIANKITDIFDLASVTKISATTIAAMRLYEQHKLKLDTNVGAYIQEARNTNKNNILVKDLMLHQAGLVSYIPFYKRIKPTDFSRDSSELYSIKLAEHYFLRKGYYEDIMWPAMVNSHLESVGKYVYSDLSMYFMKEIVERQTTQNLADYMQEQFYKPLGMYAAGFNPRKRFSKFNIVPTEIDNYFRMDLLEGFVHDQGAAMAGGISGHAGLFSTANDMAILFQMMLNKGKYGGEEYLKPETVDLFTSKQSDVSRRGLGFDRANTGEGSKYPSELASPETYGHTGYTGTCVWVDPATNLIYVFLSNRVQSAGGNKLQSMKIRQRIQDAVYKALGTDTYMVKR